MWTQTDFDSFARTGGKHEKGFVHSNARSCPRAVVDRRRFGGAIGRPLLSRLAHGSTAGTVVYLFSLSVGRFEIVRCHDDGCRRRSPRKNSIASVRGRAKILSSYLAECGTPPAPSRPTTAAAAGRNGYERRPDDNRDVRFV